MTLNGSGPSDDFFFNTKILQTELRSLLFAKNNLSNEVELLLQRLNLKKNYLKSLKVNI